MRIKYSLIFILMIVPFCMKAQDLEMKTIKSGRDAEIFYINKSNGTREGSYTLTGWKGKVLVTGFYSSDQKDSIWIFFGTGGIINEKHYYKNVSKEECIVKATLSPGNKNFENALLISKGLAKDGLASAAGTPKKLADLALFVYLNNSKMVGLQKIAEPLFNYLAARAIKKGRLKELELKYCTL